MKITHVRETSKFPIVAVTKLSFKTHLHTEVASKPKVKKEIRTRPRIQAATIITLANVYSKINKTPPLNTIRPRILSTLEYYLPSNTICP